MQNTTINSKFMFFNISGPLIEMDMVDCVRSWQVGVRKRKDCYREKKKREQKRKSLRGRHRYFGRLASCVYIECWRRFHYQQNAVNVIRKFPRYVRKKEEAAKIVPISDGAYSNQGCNLAPVRLHVEYNNKKQNENIHQHWFNFSTLKYST